MKNLSILILLSLLTACATPLSLEKDGPSLVSELSISDEKPLYISYAYFVLTNQLSASKSGPYEGGVFLLTKDNIYLSMNKKKDDSSKIRKKIPIEKSKLYIATHGVRKQIQILYGTEVFAVDISPNKSTVSASAALEIGLKLKELGIGEWKSEKFYGLDGIVVPIIL
jgi:hypothetical protein